MGNYNLSYVIINGAIAIVELKGEVEANKSDLFKAEFLEIVNKIIEPNPFVIINCAQLEYIYSRGFGALLEVNYAVESNGGEMCLIILKPNLYTTFDTLSIFDRLPYFSNQEKALEYYNRRKLQKKL
jgi:anti-anti-sigma factor